jgi:hypothetical protein
MIIEIDNLSSIIEFTSLNNHCKENWTFIPLINSKTSFENVELRKIISYEKCFYSSELISELTTSCIFETNWCGEPNEIPSFLPSSHWHWDWQAGIHCFASLTNHEPDFSSPPLYLSLQRYDATQRGQCRGIIVRGHPVSSEAGRRGSWEGKWIGVRLGLCSSPHLSMAKCSA